MANYTIPSIFTAVDKFSSPVSKMGKTAESTFAKMDRQIRNIGKQSFAVSKKAALVGSAIAVPLIAAGNEAVKFEEKMSNVSTLIDTSKESMKDMSSEVLKMATKLPVTVDDLTTSLYDIRSAGIDADKAMNTLNVSAKLSVSGLSTASEATDVMTSSLNAFNAQGLSADETANILFKTVKFGKTTISGISQSFGQAAPTIAAAGISLQDFSAATAALTTVGQPASVAQNRLAQSINKLNKPTAEMEALFKKLGVKSGKELISTSDNLVHVFSRLDKAAKKHDINLAKAWGSSEALGASTALLGDQNAAYTSTLKDMESGTDAVNEAFKKQSETGKANMQVLKNNLQVVAIKIGTALLPVVTKLAESLVPMITKFSEWIEKNPKLVSQIATLAVKAVLLAGAISAGAFAVGVLTKAYAAARTVQKAFNVVSVITKTLMTGNLMMLRKNAVALKSFRIATKVATTVQNALNKAWLMSPIGLIVAGTAAIAVGIYAVTKALSSGTEAQKLNNEVQKRTLDGSRDQRVEAAMLFEKLRNLKSGTDAYKETLAKVEQMQPGITKEFDLQTKSIKNLNLAEKALTASILKRMEAQVQQDMAKESLKEAAMIDERTVSKTEVLLNKLPSWMGGGATQKFEDRSAQLKENASRLIKKSAKSQVENEGMIGATGSINGGGKTETLTKEEQTLNIQLNGLPNGSSAKITGSGNIPKLSTTN